MAIKEWTRVYGTGGLDSTANMPDLADETAPGAGDGDEQRSSQVEAPRDSLIVLETEMGDPTAPAAGTVLATKPTDDQKAALAGTDGTPSGTNKYVTNSDSRMSDARTPSSHASSHQNGQTDEINVAGLSGLLADPQTPAAHAHAHADTTGQGTDDHHARDHASTHGPSQTDALRLDDLEVPEDNTDLNVSTGAHGLCPKLSGNAGDALRGDGTWGAVGGASPLTTKGDLFTYDTGDQRLGVGPDGTLLKADSGEATGIKWEIPDVALTTGYAVDALNNAIVGGPHTMPDTTFAGIPSLTGIAFNVAHAGNYELLFEISYYTHSGASTSRAFFQVVIDKGLGSEKIIGGVLAHWSVAPSTTQRFRFTTFSEVLDLAAGAHTCDIEWARVAGSTMSFSMSTDDAAKVRLVRRPPVAGAVAGLQTDEFTAAGGDENFTLTTAPEVNLATPSGRGIVAVKVNGVGLKYDAAPADRFEYGFTAEKTINAKALTAGDEVEVSYLVGSPTNVADTKKPRGVRNSATAVDFSAKPGQSSTVRRTLQDGKQRYFAGTLAFAIANGVADLGYDEAASQGNSKWLYFYVVPDSGDDNLLTVRASDNPPTTGPTGYTEWEMVWETYIDGSGNLLHVRQQGNRMLCEQQTVFSAAPTGGTDEGTPGVLMAFASYVPATANAVNFSYYLNAAASSHWRVQFRDNSTDQDMWGGEVHALNGGTESLAYEIPLPTSTKSVYRRLFRNSGSDPNANWHILWITGWTDEWLED